MKDLFKFGGTVLCALLFAAQVGAHYVPQGGEFTQAALTSD